MTLLDFLEVCYLPGRTLSAGAAQQLVIAVRRFHAFVGRPLELSELTEDVFKRWLEALKDSQAPATVKGKRAAILCLWAAAHRAGLSLPAPPELPAVRAAQPTPVAWSVEQMRTLVENCRVVKGRFRSSGILKADFLRSLLLFLYDTGLRLSESIALQPQDMDLDSKSVRCGQLVFRLSEPTVAAIRQHWDPRRDLVWPFGANYHGLWESLRIALRASGLPSDRRHMFDCVRRTTSTIIAATIPQAPRRVNRLIDSGFRTIPLNVLPRLDVNFPETDSGT